MNENSARWHLDSIATHNSNLFSTLLYERHLISDSLKILEDVQTEEGDCLRGYFAKKDKVRYWVDEKVLNFLPIRMSDITQEFTYKENVVKLIKNPVPFKIVPEHSMEYRKLIDYMAPFEHSVPKIWTLMKIIGVTCYSSKSFLCIATNPAFGKSSIFDIIHGVTDKCPVFTPRSVPGVLNKITGTGNIVFDDVLATKKDVRDIMEEFSLQIAGGKSVYINGALKSQNTKMKYDCSNQSITYLYNTVDCYKDPEKRYFENMFENNKAIGTRFLKLKFEGKLTEKFGRDVNVIKIAEENRDVYVAYAKELLWIQEQRLQNKIVRKWKPHKDVIIKGRTRITYDEISLGVDIYASSQEEYNEYMGLLDQAIEDYQVMISSIGETITDKITVPENEPDEVVNEFIGIGDGTLLEDE